MKLGVQKKRLLVLYAASSTYTAAIEDYLLAFKNYSEFEVWFANAAEGAPVGCPLDFFDTIHIHYSVRLSFVDYLSAEFAKELKRFKGIKVLSIQDEYESTEIARRWIESLQVDIVLTCIPQKFIQNVYPKSRFPNTVFKTVLTGYVTEALSRTTRTEISNRENHIVYRGRRLHPVYGRLGYEKHLIGTEVKRRAIEAGLKIDIEVDDNQRIYGSRWINFIKSGKCTLATESGANVFDFDGKLRRSIESHIEKTGEKDFENLYQKFLINEEGRYAWMNQISPKMFESIALGTVLIMFEGEYSGILKPWVHFIPLKKDFSNWSEVVDLIQNDEFLNKIAKSAHQDIIASGKWSYSKFINELDELVKSQGSAHLAKLSGTPITVMIGSTTNGPFKPNCFNLPVGNGFIANMVPLHKPVSISKLRKTIQSEFDLSRPGEWIRLCWFLTVPERYRLRVGRELKMKIKRLIGAI